MVGRKKVKAEEKLKVWVRSGGRCIICNRYLLEGQLSAREVTFGELAHIVGYSTAKGSPRGNDALPESGRDMAENLMLVCDDEHDEIDKQRVRDLFSVNLLRNMKAKHESRIKHVTGLGPDRGTVIIRMIGNLRGNAVQLDRSSAAEAVIAHDRFPRFNLALENDGIEIDLRNIPGEDIADAEYYRSAKAVINDVIGHKLTEGVQREMVRHLSVFGFARWPLLVYLGTALDDNVTTDIYQRHRSSQKWCWPENGHAVFFDLEFPDAQPEVDESVLVLNVSGSIQPHELPDALKLLPRFTITPVGITPEPDIFSTPESVDAFKQTCRRLLSVMEASHKHVKRLHVFAAMPMSAAIALGQVLDTTVHPQLSLYDRADMGYVSSMEIDA
jgi:hypothetical protein